MAKLSALMAVAQRLEGDLARAIGHYDHLFKQTLENVSPSTLKKLQAKMVPAKKDIKRIEDKMASTRAEIASAKAAPGTQPELPFALGGGVTSVARRAGHGPLHVPRGTLPMQEGGAVGPRQGGGMFLYPAGPAPYFNAADYFLPAGEVPAATQPRSLFGSVYTPQVPASSLSFVPSETGKEDTTSQAAWSVSPGTAMLDESRNVNDPTWITSTGGASGSEPMVTGVTESPLKEIDTSHLEKKPFIEQNPQEYGTSLTEVGPPAPPVLETVEVPDYPYYVTPGGITMQGTEPLKTFDMSTFPEKIPVEPPSFGDRFQTGLSNLKTDISQIGQPTFVSDPSAEGGFREITNGDTSDSGGTKWRGEGPLKTIDRSTLPGRLGGSRGSFAEAARLGSGGLRGVGMGWSAPSMATTGAASRMRFNVDRRPDQSGHNYESYLGTSMEGKARAAANEAWAKDSGVTLDQLREAAEIRQGQSPLNRQDLRQIIEGMSGEAAVNSYAQGGGIQSLQEGGEVEMDRFFYDSENYGVEPEESGGILSLSKQPGFNLRDVTDFVFDPSSKLDKALLPLLFMPPAAAAAQLAKWGYKGTKLAKTMAHIANVQQQLPKWALGRPGPKGVKIDPRGAPILTAKDAAELKPGRILGGPTSGRRSYVQAQVLGEAAALPFSGERELEDFRTQSYAAGGIVSLPIGI
jgi:hypothetical protein